MVSIYKSVLFLLVSILFFACSKTEEEVPGENNKMPATNMQVGVAKVDITPPEGQGIELSGYSSRWGTPFEGIHDALFVKAIVVFDGTDYFVEVACDQLSVSSGRFQEITDRMEAKNIPIPFHNILISATHTHGGPSIAGEEAGTVAYASDRMDKIVEAIETAYQNLTPAYMKVMKVEAPFDIIHNRQQINPLTGQCSLGKDSDKVSDKELILKEYFDESGRSIASTMVFGVHSTIMGEHNYYVTGDFAGYTTKYLEDRRGNGHISLWMMGGGGDQSPRHYHQHTSFFQDDEKGPEALGTELGETIMTNIDNANIIEDIEIDGTVYPLELELVTGGTSTRAIYFVQISENTVIVGTPFELFSNTVKQIKDRSPYENTFVYSQTNGTARYLPTPEAYGFDCYEERSSSFKETAEPKFVSEVLAKLNEMQED